MERQGISPKAKPARHMVLFLICLIVFLGLLEGGGRVLAVLGVFGFTTEAGAVSADARQGWTLTENFSGKMGGVHVEISPQGLRVSGVQPTEPSSEAALVVWLVGDSFAFGWGLSGTETLGAQLQVLLPEGSVVRNLGVPGFGLTQSLIRLRTVDGLEPPDLVVLVANPMDFLEDLQSSTLIYKRPPPKCASGALHECAVDVPGALHELIWRSSVAYRNLRFYLEQRKAPPDLSTREKVEFGKRLAAFQQAAKARGAELLPVLHTPRIWAERTDALSLSTAKGWVDITRSLAHLLGAREHLLPDGVHWNALAAQKVATILRAMMGKNLEMLSPPPGCSAKPADASVWACSKEEGQWTRRRRVEGAGVAFDLRQVYIPPGPGLMGPTEVDLQSATASIQSVYGPEATREYFLNETPAQVIYVDPFWFDKTEVTHQAFSWSHLPGTETLAERRGYTVAYRGKGEFRRLEGSSWRKPGWLDTRVQSMARLPVTGVTWGEAREHCRQLGMDLPTEAQWERAARGQDGRRYPWGNAAPSCDRANAGYFPKSQFCAERPVAVGSYPKGRSVYGVDDAAGNIFEWVRDCRTDGYYWMEQGETWLGLPMNPTPPPAAYADDCKSRMLRGGSWAFGYDAYLRAAARATEDGATTAEWGLGFRCAAEITRTRSP